jgi:pimeloyl-ACP methyl ester carboxylesterase
VFAARYPDAVAALVLIDSTDVGGMAAVPALLRRTLLSLPLLETGLGRALSAVGLLRLATDNLVSPPESVSKLPAALRPEAKALFVRESTLTTFYREQVALITRASETDDISLPSDLPLVVIAPAKGRAAASVREDQARLLALSRRSRLVLARNSGHYVHLDEPGLVAAEIEALLRGRRATSSP